MDKMHPFQSGTKKALFFFLIFMYLPLTADLNITRLKYGGGGDWYSNPGSIENLKDFIRLNTDLHISTEKDIVDASSADLFSRHYLYMNGHGNVSFTEEEVLRLRWFLENGGFLHADDNYGMDASFRREMKRIFPEKEWVQLPRDHPVYRHFFNLPDGLPKIHEHDGQPPQGLALFHEGRMVVFYSYESDLGDGWEDPQVHNDPEALRQQALQMGTNLFLWHLKITDNR